MDSLEKIISDCTWPNPFQWAKMLERYERDWGEPFNLEKWKAIFKKEDEEKAKK